jgi:hypothetical protein
VSPEFLNKETEMDSWFDRLAKAAGRGMTRRDSLRKIGGGLLGALAVGLGAGRAQAGKPTPRPVACEPDITKSPYLTGCQLKCAGYSTAPDQFDLDGNPVSSPYARCVDGCVTCADPYYCPAGQTVSRQANIVCTGADRGIYCCDGTYRTCSNAASRGATCAPIAPPA